MYTSTDAKPWTVPMLADAKREGRKPAYFIFERR